jgi:hypothetical protein
MEDEPGALFAILSANLMAERQRAYDGAASEFLVILFVLEA